MGVIVLDFLVVWLSHDMFWYEYRKWPQISANAMHPHRNIRLKELFYLLLHLSIVVLVVKTQSLLINSLLWESWRFCKKKRTKLVALNKCFLIIVALICHYRRSGASAIHSSITKILLRNNLVYHINYMFLGEFFYLWKGEIHCWVLDILCPLSSTIETTLFDTHWTPFAGCRWWWTSRKRRQTTFLEHFCNAYQNCVLSFIWRNKSHIIAEWKRNLLLNSPVVAMLTLRAIFSKTSNRFRRVFMLGRFISKFFFCAISSRD